MGFLSMGGSLSSMTSASSAINPALALGVGASLADTANNFYWSKKNYELQSSQYDYQRLIQQLLFAREDNSIQRRVADLKTAGLSPVLAAGQGASAGQAISVNAPQMNFESKLSEAALASLSMMKMEADISKTYAENSLIELQKQKVPFELASILEGIKKTKADTYKSYKEAGYTEQKTRGEKVVSDNKELSGVGGEGPVGKTVNDLMGALKKASDFQLPQDKANTDMHKGFNKIKNESKKRR